MALTGGIDLGGTKIEARLFDKHWAIVESRRVPTPTDSYEELLAVLVDQVRWLDDVAGSEDLPVGVGIPGLIDQTTGHMLTANLPATGKSLPLDLMRNVGKAVTIINDCRAFTLSEAVLGAGRGHAAVLGMIIGTGVAGGYAVNGALVPNLNGMAGEFGHSPIPAQLVADHGFPLLPCKCGRIGCFESLIAGPGLTQLARNMTGRTVSVADIAAASEKGDSDLSSVYDAWTATVAELIKTLMMALDPQCIVLGGGLSKIPNVCAHLANAARPGLLAGTKLPHICLAEGGDSSGTRGAALAARLEPLATRHSSVAP